MSETELDAKTVERLQSIVLEAASRPAPDEELSRVIGQFLFYQNRIEQTVERLIVSLCPHIEHYLKKRNMIGFAEKLLLLESFVPDHDKISLFELLKELNKFRNKMAHREYEDSMFDEQRLLKLLSSSMDHNYENMERVGKAGKVTIAVKVSMVTSKLLDMIVVMEKLGRSEDPELEMRVKLAEACDYGILRRFRNLLMKVQTGMNDAELKKYQAQQGTFS